MADVGANLPVSAVTSSDCSMSADVTSWVALYPNGMFRGAVRRSAADPVILYEWRGDGGEFVGSIKVVDAGSKKLLLMKMPQRDVKKVGPGDWEYGVVIEDPAVDMVQQVMFGAFTVSYGVP